MPNRFFHVGKPELIVICIIIAMTIGVFALRYVLQEQRLAAGTREQTILSAIAGEKNPPAGRYSKSGSEKSADTIIRTADYVGPPIREPYIPKEKISEGTVLDINIADTTMLRKVPGIGSAFARRIASYREQLGGYYTELQLQEVYGMDYERFRKIRPYFTVRKAPRRIVLDSLSYDNVPRHPYLNYKQRSAVARLLRQNGKVGGWLQLIHLDEFSREDSIRLSHYFIP